MRDVINILVGLGVIFTAAACVPSYEDPQRGLGKELVSVSQGIEIALVRLECIEEVGDSILGISQALLTGLRVHGNNLSNEQEQAVLVSLVNAYSSACVLDRILGRIGE